MNISTPWFILLLNVQRDGALQNIKISNTNITKMIFDLSNIFSTDLVREVREGNDILIFLATFNSKYLMISHDVIKTSKY